MLARYLEHMGVSPRVKFYKLIVTKYLHNKRDKVYFLGQNN